MKRELLRVEWDPLNKKTEDACMLSFSIAERSITAFLPHDELSYSLILRFFSDDADLRDHTFYIHGKEIYNPEEWFSEHLMCIRAEMHFNPYMSIWDNLYVNSSKIRRPGGYDIRKLKATLKLMDINPNLVDKPVKDLTDLETIIFRTLFCLLIKKRLVIIYFNQFKINTDELLFLKKHLYTLMNQGMTFVIVGYEEAPLRQLAESVLYVTNGSVVYENYLEKPWTGHFQDPDDTLRRMAVSSEPFYSTRNSTTSIRGTYHVLFGEQSFHIDFGECAAILYPSVWSSETLARNIRIRRENGEDLSESQIMHIEDFSRDNNLLSNLEIWENLCLTKIIHMHPIIKYNRIRRQVCSRCYEIFGRNVGHLKPSDLSPIEIQRLIYHKILMNNPKVMICYKGLDGLDPDSAAEQERNLQSFKESGGAIIMFAFNQYHVPRIADHIIKVESIHA